MKQLCFWHHDGLVCERRRTYLKVTLLRKFVHLEFGLWSASSSSVFCPSWCTCSVVSVVGYMQCSVRRGVSAML